MLIDQFRALQIKLNSHQTIAETKRRLLETHYCWLKLTLK